MQWEQWEYSKSWTWTWTNGQATPLPSLLHRRLRLRHLPRPESCSEPWSDATPVPTAPDEDDTSADEIGIVPAHQQQRYTARDRRAPQTIGFAYNRPMRPTAKPASLPRATLKLKASTTTRLSHRSIIATISAS
jgi:hypothetical protein